MRRKIRRLLTNAAYNLHSCGIPEALPAGSRPWQNAPVGERLSYGLGSMIGFSLWPWRATITIESRNRKVLDRPAALAFWHGRTIGLLMDRLGCGAVAMASRSADGALAAGALAAAGVRVARGSTRKGGVEALNEMEAIVRAGSPFAALTVDGPKGPWRKVKPGIVAIAKRLGVPLVPGTFSCRSARVLDSWDRLVLPRPFTRVVTVYGEPIPPEELPEEMDEAVELVGNRLDALTEDLDREVAGRPLWSAS
jgi:lysophospholipid acyltransferase (LPLAT)-like uncharacterized protein